MSLLYAVQPGFFADLYFCKLLTRANFVKNIFAIRPKHVGVLREGVALKILRNIFSRLAEIREICENKCPQTPPAIWYIHIYSKVYGIYIYSKK